MPWLVTMDTQSKVFTSIIMVWMIEKVCIAVVIFFSHPFRIKNFFAVLLVVVRSNCYVASSRGKQFCNGLVCWLLDSVCKKKKE
jgi:hypothetical protein